MHKPRRSPRALRFIPTPSSHVPILFEKDPAYFALSWPAVSLSNRPNGLAGLRKRDLVI
jgi:hypothetical protein